MASFTSIRHSKQVFAAIGWLSSLPVLLNARNTVNRVMSGQIVARGRGWSCLKE